MLCQVTFTLLNFKLKMINMSENDCDALYPFYSVIPCPTHDNINSLAAVRTMAAFRC